MAGSGRALGSGRRVAAVLKLLGCTDVDTVVVQPAVGEAVC
jgi:hypothetical protein